MDETSPCWQSLETEYITAEIIISLPISILLVVFLTKIFLHIILDLPEQNKIL